MLSHTEMECTVAMRMRALIAPLIPVKINSCKKIVKIGPVVFTARRLAKRGICRRRVSVCLSVCLCVCVCVCHTPVLYQNG